MGVQLHPASGQSRRRLYRPVSDINVTPFVDVMLVLLIIFMVTAPFLTAGVQVDLPETSSEALPGQDQPLAVTIKADGELYIQNKQVERKNFLPTLQAIVGAKPETRIFVRGDKRVPYGTIMEVVSAMHGAGFTRVAFVTETPQN